MSNSNQSPQTDAAATSTPQTNGITTQELSPKVTEAEALLRSAMQQTLSPTALNQPAVVDKMVASLAKRLVLPIEAPESPNITPEVKKGMRLARRQIALRLLKENLSLPKAERRTLREIALLSGCGLTQVKGIKAQLKENPDLKPEDIIEKKRGRKRNPFAKIPYHVYLFLMSAIHFAKPSAYGMYYTSWCADAVLLFLEICEVFVTKDFIYRFLSSMGINSKVGKRSNPNKDQAEVNLFTGDTYYELCVEAKKNGETILFLDEVSLQQGGSIYGFAAKGERATADYTQASKHTACSFLTFMGPCGFFAVFEVDGALDAEKFKSYLKYLKEKHPDKKFIIILDNCRVHHAKIVEKWMNHWRGGKGVFRPIYLPAYAPEINPVERFNNVVKGALKKAKCEKPEDVVNAAREFVQKFVEEAEKNNEKVTNLFRDEDCCFSIEIYEKVFMQETAKTAASS